MSRRWAALLLVVALSGCMDARDDDGAGSDPGEDTDSLTSSHPLMSLEDCENLILLTQVPAAWAEPLVPDDFDIFPEQIGLAYVQIELVDCRRAIRDATIDEEIVLFEASVVVEKNFEAGESAFPFLVIDSFSDSDLMIDAFGSQNVTVRSARFGIDLETLPGGIVSNRWTFSGEEFEYVLEFLNETKESGPMSERIETWYPVSPLTMGVREGTHADPTEWLIQEARLSFDGNSNLDRLFQDQENWLFDVHIRWNGYHTLTLAGGIDT